MPEARHAYYGLKGNAIVWCVRAHEGRRNRKKDERAKSVARTKRDRVSGNYKHALILLANRLTGWLSSLFLL